MAIEKVKEYLKDFDLDKNVLEFNVSSATVELAAVALGCEPAHIAKTISVYTKDESNCILIVAAGNRKLDNSKFKHFFGFKPHMVSFDDVERLTGHAPGGVCPFANPDGVEVYLDESLKDYDFVYPACGSSNSANKLTPDDLAKIVKNSKWADVCKIPEPLPQV